MIKSDAYCDHCRCYIPPHDTLQMSASGFVMTEYGKILNLSSVNLCEGCTRKALEFLNREDILHD